MKIQVVLLLSWIFVLNAYSTETKFNTVIESTYGVKFEYPAAFLKIEQYDIWDISYEGGWNRSPNTIFWDIFNYDKAIYGGTLKENSIQFANMLTAATGPENDFIGVGIYIETVVSKSQDDVLLFELKRTNHAKVKDVPKHIGYFMAVALKQENISKTRSFMLYSPTKDALYSIAKSIEVPKKYSIKSK